MTKPVDHSHDGLAGEPRLRRDLNLGTLAGLPRASRGWRATLREQLALVKADGYEAVQIWTPDDAACDAACGVGLALTGMGRARAPAEVAPLVKHQLDLGCGITTLHLGDSFESDAEMDAFAAAVLDASARHAHPVYVETHRGTLTQDIRRTLDWVERWPDLRFNADLSHWYTGHELTYGGEFQTRLARLQPVLDRVRFLHARVGNPGCIQTALDEPGESLGHFREMWTHCFAGFLRSARPGDFLSITPELLPQRLGEGAGATWLHYAQPRADSCRGAFGGEPSDRYDDAARLWDVACECFVVARQDLTLRQSHAS